MANVHHHDHDFHIPAPSIWPPLTCLGAGLCMISLVLKLHFSVMVGWILTTLGLAILVFAAFKWFRMLVLEARERGFLKVPPVLDLANRYGMIFFIVSEVMFFAAFFAAFFYLSHFNAVWPPANIETLHIALPTINTLLLLTSGATITWAHHALVQGDRATASRATKYTWMLGVIFLACQMFEYGHAAFTMSSGVYGSTFYMLTGFHGFHVLVGTLMLMVVHARLRSGDFTPKHHFYFEAAAWYWHFVDVVWVGLYLFVYFLA
jgi:cytochrome c oxidase subunit 3